MTTVGCKCFIRYCRANNVEDFLIGLKSSYTVSPLCKIKLVNISCVKIFAIFKQPCVIVKFLCKLKVV